MKKTFFIHPVESPLVTYKVTTQDHYIKEVLDLTGDPINFEFYKKLDEFDDRYFEIEPWYWFSGFETT